MCKPGNQEIYRDCWAAIRRLNGNHHIGNKEARRILLANDGCMARSEKRGVDKGLKPVLMS